MSNSPFLEHLRAYLIQWVKRGKYPTYKQVALDFGLPLKKLNCRSHPLIRALNALFQEDANMGLPPLAAAVVNGQLKVPGLGLTRQITAGAKNLTLLEWKKLHRKLMQQLKAYYRKMK
jgi:hypothetical protein